jgi:hypothetical protein
MAVCLHCDASLRYAGDFEPATPDRMDAVFAAPAPTPEARAKKLAAALRMGGVYHTMSIRGEILEHGDDRLASPCFMVQAAAGQAR